MKGLLKRLEAVLGAGGPLARRLEGWEERPEQTELARALSRAIGREEILLAEAGTGVGKSFAYLVPALLWACEEGRRILVSTRTKALQEQLDRKDLPFLQAVLGLEFTWALCLGRGNHLCLRRLERALTDRETLFPDPEQGDRLGEIRDWARRGDILGRVNELSFVPEHRLWSEIQAEQGNCLGRKCPHFAPCHWQKARRRMQTATVLVVNHALFFSDLSLRIRGGSLLPSCDLLVFDEAHHLEDIASETLGLRFGPAQLEWHLSRLSSRDGKRGLLARGGCPDFAKDMAALRKKARGFWEEVEERIPGGGELVLRCPLPDPLSGPLSELSGRLRECAEGAERDLAMELRSRADQIEGLSGLARSFGEEPDPEEVRWTERERGKALLRSAPLRVSRILRETLFGRVRPCLLVSAALGPSEGGFAWIRSRLGIEEAESLALGSPFPYVENVSLELDDGLPDPAAQTEDFEREAAERILELCLRNEGRALVLCTSWRFLRRCRDLVGSRLAEAGLPLLAQGDQPLSQLVERKRRESRTILLGTDSLWEGIDIPGEALTLVILTRFPFPVPTHPLTRARMEALEVEGLSSFRHFTLPLAVLKFRQGFGRLVRSARDRGRVVVLDPRALRKSYGRIFLEALPPCREE